MTGSGSTVLGGSGGRGLRCAAARRSIVSGTSRSNRSGNTVSPSKGGVSEVITRLAACSSRPPASRRAARACRGAGIETRSGITARIARAVSTTSLWTRAVTAATDAPVISRMPPARPKKPSTSTPGSPVADETSAVQRGAEDAAVVARDGGLAAVVGQQDQERERDQRRADQHRAAAAAASRARTAPRRRSPRAAARSRDAADQVAQRAVDQVPEERAVPAEPQHEDAEASRTRPAAARRGRRPGAA